MKRKNKISILATALIALSASALNLHADTENYSESSKSSSTTSIRYAFNEFNTENIQFSDRLGYESEHVYRGALRGRDAFFNDFQALYAFDEVDIYAGLYTIFPNSTNSRYANEIDPYVGAKSEVYDGIFVDGGYTAYRYARSTVFHNRRTTHEFFVGVSADYILNPSLYIYYDISLRQLVAEASIGHSFDLEEYLQLTGFAIETRLAAGHLHANRWYGHKSPRRENSYNYVSGHADLVYKLNERTKFKAGVRGAYNTDRKAGPANVFGQHTSTIGWGVSLNVDF